MLCPWPSKPGLDMPPHYAVSEALIVIAALYAGWVLANRNQWMGAIGVLLFGAAAAIGVYRFPSGQVQELAALHKWAGQIGGLTGMSLIASGLLGASSLLSSRTQLKTYCLALCAISVALAFFKPALAVPLFLLWSLVAILAAFALPAKSLASRFGIALIAGVMLLNLVFVRRATYLTPDVSWHAFHALIAIWIIGVCWILTRDIKH